MYSLAFTLIILAACQTVALDPLDSQRGRLHIQATDPGSNENRSPSPSISASSAPSLGRIVTTAREVEFLVYESGFPDQDEVRVTVDEAPVPGLEKFDASRQPLKVVIPLSEGTTRIVMTSLYDGSTPPNTTCLAPEPRQVRGRILNAGGQFLRNQQVGFLVERVTDYNSIVFPQMYFSPPPW